MIYYKYKINKCFTGVITPKSPSKTQLKFYISQLFPITPTKSTHNFIFLHNTTGFC